MIKLFSIALIAIGSFLEIWYYQYRFSNDGIQIWLGITIGIALTLFLALAVLNRKKKSIKPLILALVIYSVLATSAGQSFSLALSQKEEIEQEIHEIYIQEEIADIEYQIKQIDQKYEQIQAGIEKTAQTLHDRGLYRSALQVAEDRQAELIQHRTELTEKLSGLKVTALTHETIEQKKTNIYQFYNSLTGIPETWLQFIFQTILSIFIAIMAPLGIMTIQDLPKKKIQKPEIVKEPEQKKDWTKLVIAWVDINWIGKRNNKSNRILTKLTFMNYTNKHEQHFTEKEYDTLKKIALKTSCVDKNGIIKVNESQAKEKILNYIRR